MVLLEKLLFPVILGAALSCGLMAGVFFAFSAFVMKALGRLPAPSGIAAMQAINAAILNPLFFVVFLGTAALCGAAVVFALLRRQEAGANYLLAGGVLYLAGGFLVTALFNVPLNDKLASVAAGSPDAARV